MLLGAIDGEISAGELRKQESKIWSFRRSGPRTCCMVSTHAPSSTSSVTASLALLVNRKSSRPTKKPAPSHAKIRTNPFSALRSPSSRTAGKASLADGWSVRTFARQRRASDSAGRSGSFSAAPSARFAASSSSSSSPSPSTASIRGSPAALSKPPSRTSTRKPSARANSSVPAGLRPTNLRREQRGTQSGFCAWSGWSRTVEARGKRAVTSFRRSSGLGS